MPSILGHTIAAAGLTKLAFLQKRGLTIWLLAVYCSVIPDADVITFYFKIPYGHMFGHRGFSHSILFAIILGIAVTLLFFRDVPRWSPHWWRNAVFFSLVTMSHGVFDALTYGGHGVGFLVPFSGKRFFFPWRPIEVAPIGGLTRFFGAEGWPVIRSELVWIGLPVTFLVVTKYVIEQTRKKVSEGEL